MKTQRVTEQGGIKRISYRPSGLVIALVVSLFLHLVITQIGNVRRPVSSTTPAAIELADLSSLENIQVPERKTDMGRMAQTEEAGENKAPEKSKFFGKKDQTVAEEMRASRVDAFQKGQRKEMAKSETSKARQSNEPIVGNLSDEEAIRLEKLTMKDLSFNPGRVNEMAATDDGLEGVRLGDRTALNTRGNRYYSFYERVKNQLRIYWKPEVEQRSLVLAAHRGLKEGSNLVTRAIAVLSEDGAVVSVSIERSSGSIEIDQAAEIAFQRASPFPNVPKGMVDSDGQARVYWEFILHASDVPTVKMADSENSSDRVRRIH